MEDPFNISLYPCTGVADGRRGDIVLLAPAYNVVEEEVELIVERAAKAIEAFFEEME